MKTINAYLWAVLLRNGKVKRGRWKYSYRTLACGLMNNKRVERVIGICDEDDEVACKKLLEEASRLSDKWDKEKI